MHGVVGGTSLCGSGAEENSGSWLAEGLTGACALKKTEEEVVETGTVREAADLGGEIVGCTNCKPPDEASCKGDRPAGDDTPVGEVYPVVPVG